jgi:hypothetical protein
MEKNPFLEQENFFDGYQKSIGELKNNPCLIEFEKLCYELFEMNEMGKRFIELVKERYLIPGLSKPGTPTYQIDVLWGEGFKEFPRLILGCITSHQQRIIAGKGN